MSALIDSVVGNAPILLEMPHSGQVGLSGSEGVPWAIVECLHLQEIRKLAVFGCDIAVPHMTGYDDLLAEFGLSGLRNRLARVFLDHNRAPHEVSGLVLEGQPANQHQHGVIWARSIPTGVDLGQPFEQLQELVRKRARPMLTKPLGLDGFLSLLGSHYFPYHAAMQEHHQRIVAAHGHCLHLALHSLPPASITMVDGGYVCGRKVQRGSFAHGALPDVFLIHNTFRAADKKYIEIIRRVFTDEGLVVEDGTGPFAGANGVTGMYGNPGAGVNVIGIEHVSHDVELGRLDGYTAINVTRALAFKRVYRKAIEELLKA